jgi:hypothetical protein
MLYRQCSANVSRMRAGRLHVVPLMLYPHRFSTRVTRHVVCAYRERLRALHVMDWGKQPRH